MVSLFYRGLIRESLGDFYKEVKFVCALLMVTAYLFTFVEKSAYQKVFNNAAFLVENLPNGQQIPYGGYFGYLFLLKLCKHIFIKRVKKIGI